MQKMIYRFLRVSVFLIFAGIAGCTSNSQNPHNITTDVANKLTENITFDNGAFVGGVKPAENTAPELILKSVIMPDTIEFGKKFDIELYTDYAGGDVAGAVMYVPPANAGYVQVTASLEMITATTASHPSSLGAEGKYVMHLSAVIQESSIYAGKIPKLEFALYKNLAGGIAVGNYASHETKLPDAPDGGTSEDAGEASWNANGEVTMVLYVRDYNNTVFVGGDFTIIGGQARSHYAGIDGTSGLATDWISDSNGAVLALNGDSTKNKGIIGGRFTTVSGQARNHLAAFDTATRNITSWDPSPNGDVHVIFWNDIGHAFLYVSGKFTTIAGQNRNYVASFEPTTGGLTSWDPNVTGGLGVFSMHWGDNAQSIYLGGSFTTIGGQTRNNIAAVDATTGLATAWNPNANNTVYSIYRCDINVPVVYAGGSFTTIGGQTRNHLASLDLTTGLATSWNPDVNGDVYVIEKDHGPQQASVLYVGGSFTTIGGQTRNHLAAFDLATGNLKAWNPNANGTVNTITANAESSTVYVGGKFTSIGGKARNHIAAIDVVTGQVK